MNAQEEHDALLVTAFNEAIMSELSDAIAKIRHCLQQLSDDQIWWRPNESMNSIANLILHLCGNVRQWVVAGLGNAPDLRNRPQEFSQRDRIPASQLMEMLDNIALEVRHTLHDLTADNLIQRRIVQSFDVSGVGALIESIAHFRGHTQEIIHMTRMQLGESYEFEFVPNADQQGGTAN